MRFIRLPELKESPPTGAEDQETGAEEARWNLADLYPDLGSMDKDLARAKEEAVSFEGRFRGKVAALAPKDLSQAVQEFENLLVRLGRVMSYAYLDWCIDTEGHERGAPPAKDSGGLHPDHPERPLLRAGVGRCG